jgi:hypothetical protein
LVVKNGRLGYSLRVVEYRIVTVRSADSGEPVGYFDRWHALVFFGDRLLGYGQGFTRLRAERRAKKVARRLHRALPQRTLQPVRETSYRPPGTTAAESSQPATDMTAAEQALRPHDIEDLQADFRPDPAVKETSRDHSERLDAL